MNSPFAELQTRRLVIILAALVAFAPLSIDMYLPALPQIASDLQASDAQVQQTISIFLAGFSVGMLIYGPLSDRYGRRRILLAGIVLYTIASIACLQAQGAGQLTAWRLAQALGGAAASVLARAIVRDVYEVRQVASMLSWMHLITMVATLIAPLLGSHLLALAGWRSNFGVLALIGVLALVAAYREIPETHAPAMRVQSLAAAFGAYGRVLLQPQAVAYILTMGFSFGGMFAYITLSPFVYIDHFGVTPQQYAWLFSLNIGGIMLMTFFNTRLLRKHRPQRLLHLGAAVAALAGSGLLLVGSAGSGGLAAIVALLLAYVSVTGMLGANAIASLLALFPGRAGAASGLAVAMQFGLGMLLSSLASVLYDGTPAALCLVVGGAGLACWLALQLARWRSG